MPAGIYENDNVMVVREQAWHGMGIVIPEQVRPVESLSIIKADYGIDQAEVFGRWTDPVTGQVHEIPCPSARLNFRADTKEEMGIVSSIYKTFQNIEVARFAEALCEQEGETRVRVETAGTLHNGRKIWFLLRGEEFQVAHGDSIYPYVMLSNGHDGKTSLRVTPTTIRAVCANTWQMILGDFRSGIGGRNESAITIEHYGDLQGKVEQAKLALSHYGRALDDTRRAADELSQMPVSSSNLRRFFAENWNRDYAPVDMEVTTDVMRRRKEKAAEGFAKFLERFERDEYIARASWWNAFNSYSGFIQHDKIAGTALGQNVERKTRRNLFGNGNRSTNSAFELAVQMATSV